MDDKWKVYQVDDSGKCWGRFVIYLMQGDNADSILQIRLPCTEATDCLRLSHAIVKAINRAI